MKITDTEDRGVNEMFTLKNKGLMIRGEMKYAIYKER
ncbi:hypothetical protein DE170_002128 [Clostridium acetobutylicum]|nr:hypothetical protein [Clostridium acetobutylicum]